MRLERNGAQGEKILCHERGLSVSAPTPRFQQARLAPFWPACVSIPPSPKIRNIPPLGTALSILWFLHLSSTLFVEVLSANRLTFTYIRSPLVTAALLLPIALFSNPIVHRKITKRHFRSPQNRSCSDPTNLETTSLASVEHCAADLRRAAPFSSAVSSSSFGTGPILPIGRAFQLLRFSCCYA